MGELGDRPGAQDTDPQGGRHASIVTDRTHRREESRVPRRALSDGIQLGVTTRQNASMFQLGHVHAVAAVLNAAAQPD